VGGLSSLVAIDACVVVVVVVVNFGLNLALCRVGFEPSR